MELIDKTVLVAGASRPLGRAIAKSFASQGAKLILPVYDWPESIKEMEAEFKEAGYLFSIQKKDLRKNDEVASLARTIATEDGGLDYLINNIERGGMPIVHGSYSHPHNSEQWDLEFATTVKAKWLLFEHCKALLTKRKNSAIINVASIAAEVGRSGPAAPFFSDGYSLANRAIDTMTTAWAKELAPHTRVNQISLGFIDSRHGQGTRGWSQCSEDQRQEVLDHILLQRIGRCDEAADLIYFLAVRAAYMTGATIKMDGGYCLGGQSVPPLPPGILS